MIDRAGLFFLGIIMMVIMAGSCILGLIYAGFRVALALFAIFVDIMAEVFLPDKLHRKYMYSVGEWHQVKTEWESNRWATAIFDLVEGNDDAL